MPRTSGSECPPPPRLRRVRRSVAKAEGTRTGGARGPASERGEFEGAAPQLNNAQHALSSVVHGLPARIAPRPGEPPRAQAAVAADDAGHDLRRRGGRRDAVDRRRGAAGGDGVHRAARRPQPDRRGARSADNQALQKVRKLSAGLSFQDLRVIESNIENISAASARKRFTPSKLMPKPLAGDSPVVYGVSPAYATIGNLAVASGRFFDEAETTSAAPVAVLGEAAAAAPFGAEDPIGRYVKVNDQWFRVVGVAGPQLTVQSDVAGIPRRIATTSSTCRCIRRSSGWKTGRARRRTRSTASTCR